MDRNLFLTLTFSVTFQCLAQTPEPFEVRRAETVFEELPELKASEILKPELLKGSIRSPEKWWAQPHLATPRTLRLLASATRQELRPVRLAVEIAIGPP
jgi:hypothetical protein